jgi:hypothetical protein
VKSRPATGPGVLAIAAALALIVAFATGCSGNPPHIARISAQLLYEKDTASGAATEELSLFIVPEDKDGLDDLEYLHVISDASELFWSLDSDAWTSVKSQNDDWVGSSRLAVPQGEQAPRGEYRVMLYDLSGDSDEQRFRMDAPSTDIKDVPFPEATVSKGRITIAGPSDWYTVLVYTSAGVYSRSFPAQARGIDLETVRRADAALRSGFTFSVYTYWTAGSAGLLVGPYAAD